MDSLRFNLQPSRIFRSRIRSISNQAGNIQRLVLNNEDRTKLNASPDRLFYSYPRFVNHVDDRFISSLTYLYRNRLRPDSIVLDLMSSWVSHLPDEVNYEKVVGHGINAQELGRNPRLDYFFVKDLNEDQKFEFEDKYFDAVLCAVGIQYLQQPEKVFAQVFRILKPGGVFIVSFSNRMFYEKAIRAWRDGTEYGRVQLVVQYFQSIEGFTQPEIIREQPSPDKPVFSRVLGFLGLAPRPDPFNAVIAFKNFKPIYDVSMK